MDERFKTSHEADAAFAEMATVVYKGSVMSYIDQLVNLNEKANISGYAWRSMLVKGLPHELHKDLAKMQEGKPEEDDALIAAMKEVGLAHKQFLREEKLKERTTSAPSGKQKANAIGRLRSQTQLRMRRRLPLGRNPTKMLPLGLVLGRPGSPRNRRKKLWHVYLRTYGKTGAERDCAIVAVSRSTVGNGVG